MLVHQVTVMETRTSTHHVVALILVVLAAATAFMFLVGYRAIVDDVFYVYGANQWLTNPPHLGHTHWELRLPYVLSIAASFGLFGFGNWQTALPGVLSFSALAGCTYYFFSGRMGNYAAILITLVVVFSPMFFIQSTYITPDVMEVFFVAGALFLFVSATQNVGREKALLFLSGLAVGLAMNTRLTSAGLVLFFSILFLVWPHTKRVNYLVLAAGFTLSFGADLLFTYALSGDPLHKIEIAKNQHAPSKDFSVFTARSDMGKQAKETTTGASVAEPLNSNLKKPETLGPLSIEKKWRPYTALIANHEVGLLFVFLLPSIPIVLFSPLLSREEKKLILFFGAFGVTWFVSSTYLLGLRPHPRYYLGTALAAAVWVGSAFYVLVKARRYNWVAVGFAGFLFANLLSGSLDGTDLHEEQRLIELIKRYPSQTIHVHPATLSKARFFLEIEGLNKNVTTELTPPGGLYYFTPPDQYKFDPQLRPPEDWVIVEPYKRRPTILRRLIAKETLAGLLGPYIADRLSYSSPGSAMYQIPADQPGMTQVQLDYLGAKKLELTN